MRIFYSSDYVQEQLAPKFQIKPSSGWGRFIYLMRDALVEAGCELVQRPEEADIELCLGQPLLYRRPQVHPAVYWTMWESTRIYSRWVDVFNDWDLVLVPCDGNVQGFLESGVCVPVEKLWLPVCVGKLPYFERDVEGDWTFLAQAVSIDDRKAIYDVAELFTDGKMPSDTKLIIKTISPFEGLQFDIWLNDQVRLVQGRLPLETYFEEILKQPQVTVNPSAGEGFGYLAAEPMATGMAAIVSDFMGLAEFLHVKPPIAIPFETKLIDSPTAFYHGQIAFVSQDEIKKKMLFTYEHREETLEMGKRAANWVRTHCHPQRIANLLLERLETLIQQVPKRVQVYPDSRAYLDSLEWSLLELIYGVSQEQMLKDKDAAR